MKKAIDIYGAQGSAGGYRSKIIASQYRRMFDAFLEFKGETSGDTVLEVDASSRSLVHHLHQLPSWRDRDDCVSLTTSYQIDLPAHSAEVDSLRNDRGHRDTLGNRLLPFSDGQFDWVYCNALIEHAGSFEKQYELLREMNRVARKGVFVTAGNRWYPIEFNTGLPLLHWLPLDIWRRTLKLIGKRAWASEAMLNPLGSKKLMELARLLPGKPVSDVGHKRLFGIKAHFFLMIEKAHKH